MRADFNSEVQRLIDLIKTKKVVVFCGAGISFNSGVPTAINIIRYILSKLKVDDNEIKIILDSGLPFELFIADLLANSDLTVIASLLKIFAIGKPNLNHLLISELMKKDVVSNVVTTNFDCHIEDALYSSNKNRESYLESLALAKSPWENAVPIIKENWDKHVYFDLEGFKDINWNSKNIIKVHGSIAFYPSLIVTLDLVASKAISPSRLEVIKHVFSEGNHEAVLVLGYSFSDLFDIVPEIKSFDKKKQVFVVDHASGKEIIEPIGIKKDKNPLTSYTGTRFYCDTDLVIKKIWNEIIGSTIPVASINNSNWKEIIDKWYLGYDKDPSTKFLFLGNTFSNISQHRLAEKYLSTGLIIARASGRSVSIGQILVSLCNVKRHQGKYEDGLVFAEEAIEIARKAKSEIGELQCLGSIGFCYRNLGEFEKAEQYHKRALQIAMKLKNENEIIKALGGLAMIYHKMGYYNEAIQSYYKQIEIGEKTGDVTFIGNAYGNLAQVYTSMNLSTEAIKYYKLAIEIAEHTGNLKLKINNLIGLALHSEKEQATQYLDDADSLSKRIESEYFETYILATKGILLIDHGDSSGKSLFISAYNKLKEILDSDNPILQTLEDSLKKIEQAGG